MIVVTGAAGHLGRHVVRELREVLPPGEVVAAARSPEQAADLGVTVRHADYDAPETVVRALDGAEKVLLISGTAMGRRVEQHRAVIDAAAKVGVSQLVYTSAPRASTSSLPVVPEHKATEEIIFETAVPFTILRNGWYSENFLPAIEQAVRTGSFVGSAGEGKVASASRADFARAAVAVLTTDGHAGRVYELSGDQAWSYPDLAATIGEVTGVEVTYNDLEPEEHVAVLVATGLPEEVARFVVAVEQGTKAGLLAEVTGDLHELIGRPTRPIRETVIEVVNTIEDPIGSR